MAKKKQQAAKAQPVHSTTLELPAFELGRSQCRFIFRKGGKLAGRLQITGEHVYFYDAATRKMKYWTNPD
ncbi:MAG TPA: hypothetical protein VIK18_06715, partial [Pirellulales bacterium]